MAMEAQKGRNRRKAPIDQDVARTIDQLARHRDYTDQELGDLAGISRTSMQAKRAGTTGITLSETRAIAAALRVEPGVLYKSPIEAIRWAIEHPNYSYAAGDSNPEPSDKGHLAHAA